MKELQEGEAKGDNVKGTNLSPDELGNFIPCLNKIIGNLSLVRSSHEPHVYSLYAK